MRFHTSNIQKPVVTLTSRTHHQATLSPPVTRPAQPPRSPPAFGFSHGTAPRPRGAAAAQAPLVSYRCRPAAAAAAHPDAHTLSAQRRDDPKNKQINPPTPPVGGRKRERERERERAQREAAGPFSSLPSPLPSSHCSPLDPPPAAPPLLDPAAAPGRRSARPEGGSRGGGRSCSLLPPVSGSSPPALAWGGGWWWMDSLVRGVFYPLFREESKSPSVPVRFDADFRAEWCRTDPLLRLGGLIRWLLFGRWRSAGGSG